MHKQKYNVNIALISTENFTKSIEEIKSFFSFTLHYINNDFKKLTENKYNAIIIETDLEKKLPLNNIDIPKIFIQKQNQKKNTKNQFEKIFKFPLNISQFNQEVIELCKRYEFNKNSLIKIKEYILDKNERLLKKNNKVLKITEKEINFIDALNSFQKPLSKNYILKNIWSYSSDTDTHTVETHIYRLRQKIKDNFGDNNFIKNTSEGYSL